MLWHVLAVLMGWVVTKLCVFWFVPKCVHKAHSCWFEWETRNTCKNVCACVCIYISMCLLALWVCFFCEWFWFLYIFWSPASTIKEKEENQEKIKTYLKLLNIVPNFSMNLWKICVYKIYVPLSKVLCWLETNNGNNIQ